MHQHAAAAHGATHACRGCEHVFETHENLVTHARAFRHSKGNGNNGGGRRGARPIRIIPEVNLDPPFYGAAGWWVLREDFQGWQSFGIFVCDACSHEWRSAYAQKTYGQECKGCTCTKYMKPIYMWWNDERWGATEKRGGGSAPHRGDLCEACCKGHHCTALYKRDFF